MCVCACVCVCSERTEVMNSHARQKKDMADMLAAMEQEFADAENELRQVCVCVCVCVRVCEGQREQAWRCAED